MSTNVPRIRINDDTSKSNIEDINEQQPISQFPTGSTTTNASDDSEVENLLTDLSKKQSDKYRFVKFNPQMAKVESIDDLKTHFNQQVSFDDININYDDDDLPDDDDEIGWHRYKQSNKPMVGYSRGRSASPNPSRMSPIASPIRNNANLNYDDLNAYELKKLEQHLEKNMVQYPTTPISTSRCCSYTRRHKMYEQLYNFKALPLKPVLPHRTILIFVSGRVHTWVALDWVLSKFIENGDKLIIVAAIDEPVKQKPYRLNKNPQTAKQRYQLRNQPGEIINIAKDLMNYCMTVMNPNIIGRITIELVSGETKEVLKEMYRLYEPNLVCTGTKPNTRTGAPLKSWLSSKLTDRLVKNFPLPVIVVPAVNMNPFEQELETQINGVSFHKDNDDDLDSVSDSSSIASDLSTNSTESYDSYEEIANLYIDHKKELSRKLQSLQSQPINDEYFASFAKLISDTSLDLCEDIIKVQPNFTGMGAKLARCITGSNNFGHQPYKTKSLLEPQEVPEKHKMSFKEVQNQLKLNKIKSENALNNEGSSVSPSTSPPKQSLKFVNLEKPTTKKNKDHALAKCLSYDGDNRKTGMGSSRSSLDSKLEPRKSHPGFINTNDDNSMDSNSKKKKKKKKFFGLF